MPSSTVDAFRQPKIHKVKPWRNPVETSLPVKLLPELRGLVSETIKFVSHHVYVAQATAAVLHPIV
jgi:hypothetical protein